MLIMRRIINAQWLSLGQNVWFLLVVLTGSARAGGRHHSPEVWSGGVWFKGRHSARYYYRGSRTKLDPIFVFNELEVGPQTIPAPSSLAEKMTFFGTYLR